MKPTIIVFEGVDKSGKTTLLNEFNKKTNFKYIVLDRFTTSSKVYNSRFCRDTNDYMYYLNVEKVFYNNFDVIIVYCFTSQDIVIDRLKEAKEELPFELENIELVDSRFRHEMIVR